MCLQSDTLSFNLLSCIERQREREGEMERAKGKPEAKKKKGGQKKS